MPTLVCSKKSLLALSYSVLDAARQPSQGGSCAPSDTQENANRGTVVAQSQVVNPVALNMLMARTNRRYTANSSSNTFASLRCKSSPPWLLCFIKQNRIIFAAYLRGIFCSAPLDHLSVLELKAVYLNIDRYHLIVAPKLRIKTTSTVDVVTTSGKVVRFKACKLSGFGYGLGRPRLSS